MRRLDETEKMLLQKCCKTVAILLLECCKKRQKMANFCVIQYAYNQLITPNPQLKLPTNKFVVVKIVN